MVIDGLTAEQCKMLDKMWGLDTSEELLSWFKTLSDRKLQTALVLFELMVQEQNEPEVADGKLAKKMLKQIGVKS
ncbi:hypothetical protein N8072_01430 [bacterium]|nr:hypothetical protein [bacterium]MDB4128599.1 hypothetical protein [bacterium]MDC1257315.1 hypothetical protein [bacterium]